MGSKLRWVLLVRNQLISNVELNCCAVAFWITNTNIIDTLSSPPLRYLNSF
jgi:hypothetical protein